MEDIDRSKRGAICPPFVQKKKTKKTKCIKTLRAACPYGINDKVGDKTLTNNDEIFGKFFYIILIAN